jgi:hypothetical protein
MKRKYKQTKKQTKKEKENGKQKENRKTRLKVKPLNVKSTNKRKEKIIEILDKRYAQKSDILKILEELRVQRESSDRKFEQMREESDKRFQQMIEENNKRFQEMREDIEKRFQEFREDIERRFKEFREDIEKRFQEFREDIERRFQQMREDMDKRFAEVDKRFEAIDRRFEQIYDEIKRIRQDMHNTISAIGSRWGVAAERAFREGLKEILGKYFNAEVKEIYVEDKEGIIKGRPGKYQVDILVQDNINILIEVKAQATDLDVLHLHRIGLVYEKEKGVKPRLILLTPYARDEAWAEGRILGDVEILTSPQNFKP